MDVSVIIPTYNRAKELKETLSSILKQSILPKEIIVVDDSDDFKTEDLISQISKDFLDKNVMLKYFRNAKQKSLTLARNMGTRQATGDIILFFDDDVVLDDKYIKKILDVYETFPNAQGVQGCIKKDFAKLENLLCKLFFLSHAEKNKSRILPSGEEIDSYPLTETINCQRLSGANQSYRRATFQRFRFDEKLCGYAYMEDVDFSYRIYKAYPNALYATPHAKLIHKTKSSKLPNRSQIFMRAVYHTYFF